MQKFEYPEIEVVLMVSEDIAAGPSMGAGEEGGGSGDLE